MHGYPAWEGKAARSVIDEKTAMPGALRPISHALPGTFSDIDLEAEPLIADARSVSRAEAGRSIGGDRLHDRTAERLGIGFDPRVREAAQFRVTQDR